MLVPSTYVKAGEELRVDASQAMHQARPGLLSLPEFWAMSAARGGPTCTLFGCRFGGRALAKATVGIAMISTVMSKR